MSSASYFDDFDSVFTSQQRDRFWELYFTFGIGFTVCLLAAGVVSWAINWRISRTPSFVARKLAAAASDGLVRCRVWFAVFGVWTVILLCFASLVAWGVMAILDIKPVLIGVAMVTVWPGFFVFVYGMMAWYRRHWRIDSGIMRALPTPPRARAHVFVCPCRVGACLLPACGSRAPPPPPPPPPLPHHRGPLHILCAGVRLPGGGGH